MKIALIGYGKMGKAIEEAMLAGNKKHEVIVKINSGNSEKTDAHILRQADVAIEFSTPDTAYPNIIKCFEADVPVVCGTTGWTSRLPEIKKFCLDKGKSMFYAPNFSIGVNLFFQLNKYLARLMNRFDQYDICIEEIHHKQKKDAPSGTAIQLAGDLLNIVNRKTHWEKAASGNTDSLLIQSIRRDNVPGTHKIVYTSELDNIEIMHIAHSRKGFALGALTAAEWLIGKTGFFGMNDLLNLT